MIEVPKTTRNFFMAKLIRYWLPVLAMIILMFGFSTGAFSGQRTQSLIDRILIWFGFGPSGGAFSTINILARKAAHFTEYSILGALLYRAFRSGSFPVWRAAWAAYSMAVIIAWALLDEYHQYLTETRTASLSDSLLDMAGGLFALAVIHGLSRKSKINLHP